MDEQCETLSIYAESSYYILFNQQMRNVKDMGIWMSQILRGVLPRLYQSGPEWKLDWGKDCSKFLIILFLKEFYLQVTML